MFELITTKALKMDIYKKLLATINRFVAISLVLFSFITVSSANAADTATAKADAPVDAVQVKKHAEYSKKGADTCLACHDADSEFPVMNIFKTPHGLQSKKAGGHTPFAEKQCETCHGPAGNHTVKRVRKGEQREDMIDFGRNSNIPVEEKNKVCASCHTKKAKAHFDGGIHQVNEVACTDCHKVHQAKDPMLSNDTQVTGCVDCHKSKKLATQKFSTHPLKTGQMGCTSCHAPHGNDNDKMLKHETVVGTCTECHAGKRGPFLFEHQPASEDCTLCHSAHGSNQQGMLTQRAPYLCQNCHSAEGHPALANDNKGLIERRFPAQRTGSAFLLGKGCTNCHSKIHGSNHPSGSKLQR